MKPTCLSGGSRHLHLPGEMVEVEATICIRENGQNRVLTKEEWDARFPGQEPYVTASEMSSCVYSANITHNLNRMADAAGIYEALWRPEEIGATKAHDLIVRLRDGLVLLESDPVRFRAFNPANGWGNYEGLVEFVRNYHKACDQYPNADIEVSR